MILGRSRAGELLSIVIRAAYHTGDEQFFDDDQLWEVVPQDGALGA